MRSLNRLKLSLSTYTTSWLARAVVALYAVCFGYALWHGVTHKSVARSVTGDLGGTPWETLPADTRFVTSLSIGAPFLSDTVMIDYPPGRADALRTQARENQVFRPDSPLRVPGRFPNLQHMVIFGTLSETQLVDLLEFVQLKSLVLVHLADPGERGWAALARQPLESLEILSMGNDPGPSARWPKSLKTLLIHAAPLPRSDPEPSVWRSLQGLDRLETLQVPLLVNAEGRFRKEDLALLSKLPSLKSFFLDVFPSSSADSLQAQLPGVAIRPAFYQHNRVGGARILIVASALPLLLGLHILSIQFLSPARQQLPHFGWFHGLVALGFLAFLLSLQTVGLIWLGCHPLASVSLGLALIPTLFLCALLAKQGGQVPGFVQAQHLALPGIFSLVFPASLTLLYPGWFDWFLLGHQKVLALGVLAVEAICLVGFVRFFQFAQREVAESFQVTLPLTLFPKPNGPAEWTQAQGMRGWGLRLWETGQQTRLRQALSRPADPWCRQILLWRAGQSMTSPGFFLFLTVLIVLVLGLTLALPRFLNPSWQARTNIASLWPALFQPVMMGLAIPAILLVSQRTFLAQHLLRSLSRKDWVWLVFRQTAWDFSPAIVVAALGMVAYALWQPSWGWPPLDMALLALGILVLAHAATLYLVTLKPWVIIALGVGFVSAAMTLSAILSGWDKDAFPDAQRILSWPPTHWMAVLGFAALFETLAYRRWLNWELA